MAKAVDYLNRVTEAVPVLEEMSNPPPDVLVTRVAEITENPAAGGGYVCTSAPGLVILGRIGRELIANHSGEWETFADHLSSTQ